MKSTKELPSRKKLLNILYAAVSAVFLLSACSTDNGAMPTPTESITPVVTVSPSPTLSPTPTAYETTEPLYTIATVTTLEDEKFAYIRAEKSPNSQVLGAAEEGVELAVTMQDAGWCRVIFDGGEAFMESRLLTIKPGQEPLPEQKIYTYVPVKKETGLVETKYNNKLSVFEVEYTDKNGVVKNVLDIYTESGTMLASDASLVLNNAKITGYIIPEASSETPTETPSSTESLPSAEASGSPSEAPVETEPAASAEASPTPSATPAPVRVKITVKNGKVTSCEGITLDKDESFEPGKDTGKIITGNNTVIEEVGALLKDAVFEVTDGMIYYNNTYVKLEEDYYLLPKKLIDNLVDVSRYGEEGITINMLLAQDGNMLGDAIYGHNTCLLQKGTLEKLNEAEKIFEKDGYSIIIYDAYRPYSVTVALYDKYKNGTYVAGKRFGSVHNKGAAIDMSLLDSEGNPVEMPSEIHTLDSSSNRDANMTAEAKENMNYMASVMKSCGFNIISSEWWHFSDLNYTDYLRTDHDLNSVLRVVYK